MTFLPRHLALYSERMEKHGDKLIRNIEIRKTNAETYLIKQEPQLSFCLTHPLAETVSTFAHEESHSLGATTALISQGTCYQCFSSA